MRHVKVDLFVIAQSGLVLLAELNSTAVLSPLSIKVARSVARFCTRKVPLVLG